MCRPESRQVGNDLPQAEHGLRQDLGGCLLVPEPDNIGGLAEAISLDHALILPTTLTVDASNSHEGGETESLSSLRLTPAVG
jgi:hypothetical protein